MKNDLYRKLTSITLMTIMFAGGMTIAIPGELPTAVAQTGTLSVSAEAAGVFGGPQVIEIVVDDPDRADADDLSPDVNIDEQRVHNDTVSHWKVVCVCCRKNIIYCQRASKLMMMPMLDTNEILRDLPTPGADESWPTGPPDYRPDVPV